MADERKRKLEELRKKKKQLQMMVNNKEPANPQPAPQKNPASERPSQSKETAKKKPESSTPTTSSSTSLRTHAKKNSFFDNNKNAKLIEIHIKKINESLRTSRSEHFLQGIYPDLKSEETQYKLPEEFEEEKKIIHL